MVMDARTGKVLHSRNAETRLHPASLTKMMTLYIAFEAIRRGEISADTRVKISKKAAAEPPSKLGLKSGQKIRLRYLLRAAAVKSGNDAATAIGEAISGSEAAFARRMNRTAKALGMTRTTFKNAHGLTEAGHLSTARDMTILGRRLFYDYPEYYNMFSRRTTDAGLRTVSNTNRRLLANYRGADGIKTGYTRAAGYNLVASAERGNERIIATVFGGRSTISRNARVAELLDMGFKRAPSHATVRKPALPTYGPKKSKKGKITIVAQSPRPKLRPVPASAPSEPVPSFSLSEEDMLLALADSIGQTVQLSAKNLALPKPDEKIPEASSNQVDPQDLAEPKALTRSPKPKLRPPSKPAKIARLPRPLSDGSYGITVGRYVTRFEAEKVLVKTALAELTTLDGALREVVKSSKGFDATFKGLSADRAALACRRLKARGATCTLLNQG
ncbi:MAG: D-alanyl-D-alanine carboxypeptidase family protein [Pseudomonadota bacterium]